MILSFKKKFPWGEPTNFEQKILDGAKIHTIRLDPKDRWYKGRLIHHANGVRTKNYRNFKINLCESTEKIWLIPEKQWVQVLNQQGDWVDIDIDLLAKNDGFDSASDFWRWFKDPFVGKIIHWTDLQYGLL